MASALHNDALVRRLVLAGVVAAACACHSASPPTTGEFAPSSPAPHITTFSWRNSTATLACENLLTGEDIASILCSADSDAAVRITVTDVGGDCSPSNLPHGSRCKTILGAGRVEGSWEAPWGPGAMETAMTVTATCEVLDAQGRVADSRTTCIPSVGFIPPQRYFQPPWPASCLAQLLGCHEAP